MLEKGTVTEIKGEKAEIMAEAVCILKSLKKSLGQEDYKKVIQDTNAISSI